VGANVDEYVPRLPSALDEGGKRGVPDALEQDGLLDEVLYVQLHPEAKSKLVPLGTEHPDPSREGAEVRGQALAERKRPRPSGQSNRGESNP